MNPTINLKEMKPGFFTILEKFKSELFYVLIAVYFFFCIFYAFERILNTDCSLQLFQIINNKNFFFQENRFGVWLTQIPLLVAVYIHIPIKFLVYVYSISFPLLYLLIIWINYKIFKSREAALATILSLIFGVAFTFFHSTTETHQLLALSCLLFGLLQSKERFSKSYFFYTLLVFLSLWCLFTHPNAVFTLFFVTGLAFLQRKINRLDVILSISLIVLFILIKTSLSQKGNYDSRQYDQLLNFKETLPNFFSLYSFRFLYTQILTTYLAGFCVIIIVWLKYKKLAELLFCTICFLIFTTLTILTFSNGDSAAMMEKSFMPGFFMFILIYSIFFYQTKNKIIYTVITLLLCFSSFINIINASQPYTKRLNLLSAIMEGMDKNSPKIIANFSDFDIPNHWGTSMDALILSQCISDTAKTIFLTEDKFGCYSDTTNPALFLYLPWDPYKIKTFNSIYFNLPAIPYKIYKKEQKKYSLLKQYTFDNTKDPNIRTDSTGNSFYKTLPDQEFCITNQRIFNELTPKDRIWIKVSMDIRFPLGFQGQLPCMVMTMEHKGGTYGYLAPEIKIDSAGNKWHKYELEYLAPEIRTKKDIWKCYIWKRGKSTFDIDNFKIEIYEPRY